MIQWQYLWTDLFIDVLGLGKIVGHYKTYASLISRLNTYCILWRRTQHWLWALISNIIGLLVFDAFWCQNSLPVDCHGTCLLARFSNSMVRKEGLSSITICQCLLNFFSILVCQPICKVPFWSFRLMDLYYASLVVVTTSLQHSPASMVIYRLAWVGTGSRIHIIVARGESRRRGFDGVRASLYCGPIGWALIDWPWFVRAASDKEFEYSHF